jgi:hypothetical protein
MSAGSKSYKLYLKTKENYVELETDYCKYRKIVKIQNKLCKKIKIKIYSGSS